MAKAIYDGAVIAESDAVEHVEGNAYFPPGSVRWEALRPSINTAPTLCHWKGWAQYYDYVDGERVRENVGWVYFDPRDEARRIKGHIAFWNGIEVEDGPEGAGYVEPAPESRKGLTGLGALCWMLSKSPETRLDEAAIAEKTGLTPGEVVALWDHPQTVRYRTRYRWRLAGDGSSEAPVALEKES